MKKIFYLLALVAVVLLLNSCEDKLNLLPEDYYSGQEGVFWNNEAQVNGFVYGLHSGLRNDYTMLFQLGEERGGTLRTGTSSMGTSLNDERIKSNNLDANNTGISGWYDIYSSLLNINLFISKVENECAFLSKISRDNYLAQAYGFRALYYFYLYRTFGGVPIITTPDVMTGKITPERFYIARNTVEETLTFIKDDIAKSENFYGTATPIKERSMWSIYSTRMLKADVYLWSAKVPMGDPAKGGHVITLASKAADLAIAKTALSGVIGNADFSLLATFSTIFSSKSNSVNKEVIYALRFSDTEATNWGGMFLYAGDATFINSKYDRTGTKITTDILTLNGLGGVFRHEYKNDLFNSYDAADTRRDATFMEFYSNAAKTTGMGLIMKKGIGSINALGLRRFDSDIILYRYADALLMMAEVENGLGNPCASYINEVRKRAFGGTLLPANTYVDGTFAANELAILKERDKEFVWEGKRWFDVVRMRDASNSSLAFSAAANYPTTTPLISPTSPHLLLWPIDINTLNYNPALIQTPGY